MGVPPVPPRIKFKYGFSSTVERILKYYEEGYKRPEIALLVGITPSAMSKSVRVYLTALGRTPDSGHVEVKNKAIELVKKLDAGEISLNTADVTLIGCIRQISGSGKPTYLKANTTANPDQQLAAYKRAVARLEGMCFALDKMPPVVHSGIAKEQREEIETRLAACRRILERRIKILRKDENAEAND